MCYDSLIGEKISRVAVKSWIILKYHFEHFLHRNCPEMWDEELGRNVFDESPKMYVYFWQNKHVFCHLKKSVFSLCVVTLSQFLICASCSGVHASLRPADDLQSPADFWRQGGPPAAGF